MGLSKLRKFLFVCAAVPFCAVFEDVLTLFVLAVGGCILHFVLAVGTSFCHFGGFLFRKDVDFYMEKTCLLYPQFLRKTGYY